MTSHELGFPFPNLQRAVDGVNNKLPSKKDDAKVLRVDIPTFLPNFKLFKKLPPELQLLIWSFAIPDPQIIQISVINRKPTVLRSPRAPNGSRVSIEPKRLYSNYKPAGILSACYASRSAALKWFQPIFCAQFGYAIYFDFERDLLQFETKDSTTMFYELSPNFGPCSLHMDTVRNIALRLGWEHDEDDLVDICTNFRGLRHLAIIEPDGTWAYPSRDLAGWVAKPLTKTPEELEGLWDSISLDIRGITQDTRRGPFKRSQKWDPPTLTIGSGREWREMRRLILEEEGRLSDRMDWQITFRSDFELERKDVPGVEVALSKLEI